MSNVNGQKMKPKTGRPRQVAACEGFASFEKKSLTSKGPIYIENLKTKTAGGTFN